MSLFVINRYEGEKEQSAVANETDHLSRLLKRIEERKQQKLLQQSQTQSTVGTSKPKQKKKSKKRKINEDSLNIETPASPRDSETRSQQESISKYESQTPRVPHNENLTNLSENEETVKNDGTWTNLKENEEGTEENLGEARKKTVEIEKNAGFVILGSKSHKKPKEVRRVLPEWLSRPEIIPRDLDSGPTLAEAARSGILDGGTVELLKKNGMEKLFPVQERMLTWLTKSNEERRRGFWIRDVCVSAPTGSGKTLAYVLPVIQILKSRLVPKIRCLVVVPVQELAAQVYKVMLAYATCTDLKVALLSGASSFDQEQNNVVKKNSRGEYVSLVDIVIATPGRLIDHIFKTAGFSLDNLRFLVIDEADKNADWLEYIPEQHRMLPRLNLANMRESKMPAQKLLFSATLTQDPEKLSRLCLLRPILFTSVLVTNRDGDVDLDKESGDFIGRYTVPEELEERAVECASEFKPVALYHLLTSNKNENDKIKQEEEIKQESIMNEGTSDGFERNKIPKTLVFTNSGDTAHRLAILLNSMLKSDNVEVGELSAKFTPKEREDVLGNFAKGKVQVLVCSDALARGVDIPGVRLVISYDLPKHVKGYVHRAGRTGRAGRKGTAVSIVTSKQAGAFRRMLVNGRKTAPSVERLENLESVAAESNFEEHLENLKNVLEMEKRCQLDRVKSDKRK